MEKTNIARELLKKYNAGTCSPEERETVESWYLSEMLVNGEDLKSPNYALAKKEIWNEIAKDQPSLNKKKDRQPIWLAAASILCILGIGIALYLQNPRRQEQIAGPVLPGGNKAILTLSNGKKIILTDLEKGDVATQLGFKVTVTASGQLSYKIDPVLVAETKGMVYNSIETPAGGQYQIELSDGTKVWLNAKSSLRYPVKFSEDERKIELDGEAYFEVAHAPDRPFKVASAKQIVTVLGTHFNVNNYRDEPEAKTTLVEGSVKVSNRHQLSRKLKPGEQALLTGDEISVRTVDVDQAIAWHHNDMSFEGAKLNSIMRQVSRWYDVEVVYQGEIEEMEFGGSISRDKSIQEVLKVLESTQSVKFKIEGRRVIVMP